MHDPAFLAHLKSHPEDDAALLVYSDWLDDQGDSARAEFLRLQNDALRRGHEDAALPGLIARLREIGRTLPEDWLAIISRPRLDGTVWAGEDSAMGYLIYRFLETHVLSYTSGTGSFANGTWKQIGPVVLIETNQHYADYEGIIAANRIVGKARNVTDREWTWEVALTTEAEARRNAPYSPRLSHELPPLETADEAEAGRG
jgi:uncharacterized protein (TIGR02996 family)